MMKDYFLYILLSCTFFYFSCTNNNSGKATSLEKGYKISLDSLKLDSLLNGKLTLSKTNADTSIGNLYLEEGDKLMVKGQYKQALLLFQKAASIFEENLPTSRDNLVLAWHNLGRANNGTMDFKNSELFYKKALEERIKIYGVENLVLADSYFGLGNLFEFQQKNQQAVKYFLESKKIYDANKVICLARLGDLLQNLAGSYGALGDSDKKEEYMLQAVNTYLCSEDPSSAQLANVYQRLASHYNFAKNDPEKALEYLNLANRIIEEAEDLNEAYLSNIYIAWGGIYSRNGLFVEAENNLEKALSLIEKLYGKDSPYSYSVYSELGYINKRLKHFTTSANYFQKTLQICIKAYGENSKRTNRVYNNLADVYLSLEQYDLAKEYILKSIAFWEQFENPNLTQLYDAYENYGDILLETGDNEEAIKFIKKALSIKEELSPKLNSGIGYSNKLLGDAQLKLNRIDEAEVYYHKALVIYKEVYGTESAHIASAYNNLANLSLQNNLPEEGLDLLTEAEKALNYQHIDSLHLVLDLNVLIRVIEKKAEAFYKLYEESNSEPYLMKAYEMQLLGMSLYKKYLKGIFDEAPSLEDLTICNCNYDISASVFKELIENNGVEKFGEELFSYLELGKGVKLRKAIQDQKIDYSLFIDEQERIEEYRLKQQIQKLQIRRHEDLKELTDEKERAAVFTNYSSRLLDLERSYNELVQGFIKSAPEYYNLNHNNQIITISGVQDSLLVENQALVEYLVGDSSILAFVILKDTFYFHQSKKDFPLEDLIAQMRCGILSGFTESPVTCGGLNEKEASNQFVNSANYLYQKLFAGVDSLIPEGADILIVPDGVLGYLPFDALLVKSPAENQAFHENHYLLKDHAISYAYSATLQEEMQYRRHFKDPKYGLLAFAPSFEEPDNLNRDSSFIAALSINTYNRQNQLGPLKFNIPEVENISQIINGKVLTGSMATKEAFKSLAPDYQILHLSTHGKANDLVGDYSFLAFQQSGKDAVDGSLYNKELYNLKLNADMVVLSACETGIGELKKGEGIISMARGFSYAGAKSLITSLWSVNDQSTQVLMELFYQNLRDGLSKSASLRKAKLDYLENYPNLGQEPYYWAAFIPIGDMSALDISSKNNFLVWLILGSILIGFFGWKLYKKHKL